MANPISEPNDVERRDNSLYVISPSFVTPTLNSLAMASNPNDGIFAFYMDRYYPTARKVSMKYRRGNSRNPVQRVPSVPE
jgi:hypothetical protein